LVDESFSVFRIGTAAQSPAAHKPGTPVHPPKYSLTRSRPRSFSQGNDAITGLGFTPAVQMRVLAGIDVPSLNETPSPIVARHACAFDHFHVALPQFVFGITSKAPSPNLLAIGNFPRMNHHNSNQLLAQLRVIIATRPSRTKSLTAPVVSVPEKTATGCDERE